MICWIRQRYSGEGTSGLSRNSQGRPNGEPNSASEGEIDTLPVIPEVGDESNQTQLDEHGGKPSAGVETSQLFRQTQDEKNLQESE